MSVSGVHRDRSLGERVLPPFDAAASGREAVPGGPTGLPSTSPATLGPLGREEGRVERRLVGSGPNES